MNAFWISCGVIFVAELGDKSQLMAMTFAARYRARTVLLAIAAATAAVHLLSVLIGEIAGQSLPTRPIAVLAGLAFVGFAWWTLRGDELDDEAGARKSARASVFWAVATSFVLAELGDKTMLATVTLATQHGLVGTWIGSTVGMVAADALAVLLGQRVARRVSGRAIRWSAAALFAAFGIYSILSGVMDW